MQSPPYNIFPVIMSDDIILREVVASDLKNILEIQFYDGKLAETEAEGKVMLDKIDQNYLDGDSIHWGIADKTSDEIMGTLGYYRGFKNKTGELGCVLLDKFRGQGFMSKAMGLAIDFGINNMQLKHIMAITTTDNVTAIKLMERLGFVKVKNLEDNEVEFEFVNKKGGN